MKRTKRWMALGLSAMLLAGLAGCGNGGGQEGSVPGEGTQDGGTQDSAQEFSTQEGSQDQADAGPVTLEWWYRGNGIQKDTELVEEAFNELLKT